jgi:dTMP kinase
MRGKFITFEGIDGAGKSTHLAWLAEWLQGRGIKVRITREPGGTDLGEGLRQLLLDRGQRLHPETEALLMFAARREHLDKVIVPTLTAGLWVLCDRFTDATFAYQAGGSGTAWDKIEALEHWVQGNLQPDITILFDVAPEIGRRRSGRIKNPDRFEQEQGEFFQRVRQAYLRRAHEHPGRIHVIDAGASIADIRQELGRRFLVICGDG